MGPRRILVRCVFSSPYTLSRTRTPRKRENPRRCRRWRDKSSLSLLGSLSQADTRELTDRTVAIKPPERGSEYSTPRCGSHGVSASGKERADDNKRRQEREMRACPARGMRHEVYRRQPRRAMHTRRGSPGCGGVVRPLEKKKRERERESEGRERRGRNNGGGCCVAAQRAIFTRGVGFCEFQPQNVIAPAEVP